MFKCRNIKHTVLTSCLFLGSFLSGCNGSLLKDQSKIIPHIMKEGDRIIAGNDNVGILTITAGKDNIRYLTLSGKSRGVTWLGDTRRVKLTEREMKIYKVSSLGLYCNSNVKGFRHNEGRGPTRVEMTEAQVHFDNIEAAKHLLDPNKYDKCCASEAWTSNGLYIRWEDVYPEYWFIPTKQPYLYIELLQIYIGDNKPENLPNVSNDQIEIEHLTDEQLKKFEKSVSGFKLF